jgi:HSP20 family protein
LSPASQFQNLKNTKGNLNMNAVANNETNTAKPTVETNGSTRRYVSPEVNIFETNDGYVLQAEVPGVNKEGLNITLEDNQLTIVGHRQTDSNNAGLVYRESSNADYRRVFELDPAIDTTKINAKVEQGILTLTLPKSERVKPRKVTISD